MAIKSTLLTVILGFLLTQTAIAEDVVQSFSGIPWGTTVEEIEGLQETARSGDIRYYKRSEDFYSIGGVTLSEVIYGFYQDAYFAAYMNLTSADALAKIKRHLDTVYGDPRTQLFLKKTIYIWDYENVKIKLKQYTGRSNAKLAFYYTPLSIQANASKPGASGEKIYKLDTGEQEYDF
jgi:hypothetical protein